MRKLYRCRWDKKIGGVCGGLGQYLQCDPTLIRMLLVFLCAVTAVIPFLIIYILLWILLPLGPPIYVQILGNKLYRSKNHKKLAGICGGVGEMLHINPNLIRLLTLVLTFITAFLPVMISYVIGAFIIPENPD
jgi:phage shock protein PspC (stress-responsive transcriptional regulator)